MLTLLKEVIGVVVFVPMLIYSVVAPFALWFCIGMAILDWWITS